MRLEIQLGVAFQRRQNVLAVDLVELVLVYTCVHSGPLLLLAGFRFATHLLRLFCRLQGQVDHVY